MYDRRIHHPGAGDADHRLSHPVRMLDLPIMSEGHSSPWLTVALGADRGRVALMHPPGATPPGKVAIPPSSENDGLLRRAS
jgi:hypothetical protein